MRCLFVTSHWYLPQMIGGAESSTHELCMHLRARGHDVGVLAVVRPRTLRAACHRVRKLVGGRDAVPDRAAGYPVFRCRRSVIDSIDDVLARFMPDVVVVQVGALATMAEAFLARGVPVIVYLRDVEFRWYGGALPQHPLVRYVANSKFTASRHHDAFRIRPDIVPPLVWPERYICASDRTHVTFVNPVPEKGAEIAFALARARPDIPFLVVEGWPMDRHMRWMHRSRLADAGNVTWLRSVRDMRKIYARTRILLAPSLWEEGWGRVITEAQISGIPVLASNRGGLPESVGPGGLLVAHDAPLDRWRNALSAMWDDVDVYGQLSAAAALHSRRPAIQPDRLIDRFIAILQAHVQDGPQPNLPADQTKVSASAGAHAPLRAANG